MRQKAKASAQQAGSLPGTRPDNAKQTCDSILLALISVQGRPWTYDEVAEISGVSKTTVQRYLKREVWEIMSADQLLEHRTRAGSMGSTVIEAARFVNSYYSQLLQEA